MTNCAITNNAILMDCVRLIMSMLKMVYYPFLLNRILYDILLLLSLYYYQYPLLIKGHSSVNSSSNYLQLLTIYWLSLS